MVNLEKDKNIDINNVKFLDNKIVFLSALFIYIISSIIAIFTYKYYYADGVYFFVDLLNKKNEVWSISNDNSVLRLFINLYNQFLFNIFNKIGINNKNLLSITFAIPLYFSNIFGMLIIYLISKKDNKTHMILFPALSYVLFNILSEIFIINPAINAFWLYYIIFMFSMVEYKYSKFDYITLCIVLLLSLKSHEGILIFGVMIVIAIILKVRIEKEKNFKIRLTILIILLGEVLYTFVWREGQTTQQSVSSDYLKNILVLLDYKSILNSNMIISFIGILMIIFFARKLINYGTYKCLLSIIVVILIMAVLNGMLINPSLEYTYRVFITIGEMIFIFLSFLEFEWKLFSKIIGVKWNSIAYIFAGLLICQSIYQIGNSFYWYSYLKSFKMQMYNNNECLIEDNAMYFSNKEDKFEWPWNQSALSIALQSDYDIDRLILPADYENYPINIDSDNKKIYIPFMTINSNVFNIDPLLEKLVVNNTWKKYDGIIEYNNIRLTCTQQEYIADTNEQLTIKVKIYNNSTENISNNKNLLSYHIYDSNGKIVVWDGIRTYLDGSIFDNSTKMVNQTLDLSVCESGKTYYCNIDMLKEGKFWYSEKGIETTTIKIIIK